MKKKVLSILLMITLSFSLVACNNTKEKNDEQNVETNSESSSESSSIVSNEIKETSSTTSTVEIDKDNMFEDVENLGDETIVSFENYKNIVLEVGPPELTDEELESRAIAFLQEIYGYKPIMDKEIVVGDRICIDFVGKCDGKEFEGGSSSGLGYVFVVGDGGFLEGFENGLVGAKPGEVITNMVTFPEDYGVEELNGKEAEFTITVNFVCGEPHEVALTDEFLVENTRFKNVNELKDVLKEYLMELAKLNFSNYREDYVNSTLLEHLLNNAKIESLSKEEVESYYKMSIEEYENMAKDYGYTMDMFCSTFLGVSSNDFYLTSKETAIDYVAFKSICEYIAEKEKIVINENDFKEYVEEMASSSDLTSEEVEMDIVENGIKNQIMEELLQRKVIEYLSSIATINEDFID